LLNGLLAYNAAFGDVPRAGIVHRLDKDTSGLMLIARTRPVMDTLVQMIAARTVQRQYIALAHRLWSGPATRDVSSPIGRDPKNRLRMAVVDLARHAGKAARTSLELLCTGESACLVRCTLHTGRTHQIRVHLASIGHPLVGDATYGGVADAGMQRQALHAFHLALAHPVSGAPLDFRSPLPADMHAALGHWGFSLPG
jgi:23S rRNA pseudouridine1911/1915/1917 synthase